MVMDHIIQGQHASAQAGPGTGVATLITYQYFLCISLKLGRHNNQTPVAAMGVSDTSDVVVLLFIMTCSQTEL